MIPRGSALGDPEKSNAYILVRSRSVAAIRSAVVICMRRVAAGGGGISRRAGCCIFARTAGTTLKVKGIILPLNAQALPWYSEEEILVSCSLRPFVLPLGSLYAHSERRPFNHR